MKNDLQNIDDFETEEIQKMFLFDIPKLSTDFSNDFNNESNGEIFFFTPEMTVEYIERAVRVCVNEILALRNNRPLIDEKEYAWKS